MQFKGLSGPSLCWPPLTTTSQNEEEPPYEEVTPWLVSQIAPPSTNKPRPSPTLPSTLAYQATPLHSPVATSPTTNSNNPGDMPCPQLLRKHTQTLENSVHSAGVHAKMQNNIVYFINKQNLRIFVNSEQRSPKISWFHSSLISAGLPFLFLFLQKCILPCELHTLHKKIYLNCDIYWTKNGSTHSDTQPRPPPPKKKS